MVGAFDAIWKLAAERQVARRTATFIVACQRVLAAREMRGRYPDLDSGGDRRLFSRLLARLADLQRKRVEVP